VPDAEPGTTESAGPSPGPDENAGRTDRPWSRRPGVETPGEIGFVRAEIAPGGADFERPGVARRIRFVRARTAARTRSRHPLRRYDPPVRTEPKLGSFAPQSLSASARSTDLNTKHETFYVGQARPAIWVRSRSDHSIRRGPDRRLSSGADWVRSALFVLPIGPEQPYRPRLGRSARPSQNWVRSRAVPTHLIRGRLAKEPGFDVPPPPRKRIVHHHKDTTPAGSSRGDGNESREAARGSDCDGPRLEAPRGASHRPDGGRMLSIGSSGGGSRFGNLA
jgi:hypothetical protein